MSSSRRRLVVLFSICALGLTAMAEAAPAHASTYVANCGITGYLEIRPDYWSGGCTGGALNINKLHWLSYRTNSATARGRADLRMPCGNNPCYKAGTYSAPARLRLSTPRSCEAGDASGERYFSRVRVRVKMRAGNPFGYRAGWKVWRVPVPAGGECSYAP